MGSRLEKNSTAVRKRIETHDFNDEQGEEYEASKFGGFADYMRRKKIKLQNLDSELRSQAIGKLPIFRGVVAHVNGYTQPSLSDLHNLIVSHGGGFLQYLDGKTAVTHVIASQLTPKKKVEFARYRIVKPAWVVDSVNAGKLLPWDAYRVVDEGVTQKVLGFENGAIVSQANSQRQSYRDQTETSWYTAQVKRQPERNETLEAGAEAQAGVLDAQRAEIGISQNKNSTEEQEAGEMELEPLEDTDDDAELIRRKPGALVEPSEAIGPFQTVQGVSPAADEVTVPALTGRTAEKRQLTAEEHNAILLSNPQMAKSSTANPDFINQYYRESRLHHLSTWKADLKAQLQARAQEKSSSQRARQKRAPGSRRYVLHIDFDSFFAAVSLRKHPHLIDKPVVIAHGSGPGSEIASCNYPARKFGVKNGMWMKNALGLCPDLKVLPYDFKLYGEASRHFYDSILSIDGIVQSISIDEALLDVSDQCVQAGGSDGKAIQEGSIDQEQEKAEQIARDLRTLVKEKTGCDVSVGIGNNILLAKTALRKAKPAGQYLMKPDEVLDFLGDLVVTGLPGIAWSISSKLEEIGVKYVKDIRALTKERLMNHLGPKTGEKIWDYSRGIDKQEVGEQAVRKSVSAEINWGIRFINQQQAEDFVQSLCDELSKRLLEQLVKGRQLTMKVMRKAADAGMDPPKSLGHGKCDTVNKSVVLGVATTDRVIIGKEAISVLRTYGFPPGELRGLGVQMQKLEPLKPATSAGISSIDSSQRRLHFKKPAVPTAALRSPTPSFPGPDKERSTLTDRPDPIEDIVYPKRENRTAQIDGLFRKNETNEASSSKKKPLNISGTQFVQPSQIDPSVFAELPADIRSKLAHKQKSMFDSIGRPASPQPPVKSRSASPQVSDGELNFPNQSQLDPETLAELPEDVRKELLSHYRCKDNVQGRMQQVLPQSPRKIRPSLPSKKVVITPLKKQKYASIATKAKSRTKSHAMSTLTQSNFVSMPKLAAGGVKSDSLVEEEISQSFLDELPEDIRLEILAEQKRHRMKTKSGLNVAQTRRKPKALGVADTEASRGQQTLRISVQSPKPTFTSRKLSSLPELRDAMTAWVREFSNEAEDGPYDEDADALALYLERVVVDEGDMDKAVSVLKWLDHVIDMQSFRSDSLHRTWVRSLGSLQAAVQRAVQLRGLPPVRFS